MADLAKLIVFCAVVWVMWIAIPIAAALVGTILALWVLSKFMEVVDEEPENDSPQE